MSPERGNRPIRAARRILTALAALAAVVAFSAAPAHAASAELSAYPFSLSFGNYVVGTSSPQVSVNITNDGSGAASITSIAVTGPFTSPGTNCGSTLAAGATCAIAIVFTPPSVGNKSGALTVKSNAVNPTLVVNLYGTGINPTPPTLQGAPPSLTFPDTTVGSSVTRQLYISNTGTQPATLTSITASGPGYSLAGGSCGSTLPGGFNCFIHVVFAPTSAGSKAGSVTINSNATNPVLSFALTGLGVAPGSTNLALGRPASGSSVPGHPTSSAVDGDLSSYWESANNAFPQSLTVDLGRPAALSSLVLRVPQSWASRTQTLTVLGSTNGTTYTLTVPSTAYLFGTGAGNVVTIPLPTATSLRYLRLTFTANTGWPAAQLSDLQAWGV